MSLFRLLASVLALTLFAVGASRSQELRGAVVLGENGAPLPYAVVELVPGHPQRLADDSGRFVFRSAAPGRYHLIVRQIGFTPIDTLVTVPTEPGSLLVVRLWRIGITLPAVTVTGTTECRTPGAPDPALTPELASVFDQVVENARHYLLLIDSFPRTLKMERTMAELVGGARRVTRTDTLDLVAEERWPYHPGRIVGLGTGPRSGERVVRLPTLADFADTVFVANHCFQLAGIDTLEGETFVRVNFQPPTSLNDPDVEGAAYLDSATYLMRYTVVRVTRPRRVSSHLGSLVATSRFREVVPWIIVPDRVHALRKARFGREPDLVEEQRLLGVQFQRPLMRSP